MSQLAIDFTAAPTFDEALSAFIAHVVKLNEEGLHDPSLLKVYAMPGKKYARIVISRYGPGDRSAFCFVDLSTGDVLKCDGWKRPAKHARGNIFTPDNYGVRWTGANYLS